jgi:hypothetical protein
MFNLEICPDHICMKTQNEIEIFSVYIPNNANGYVARNRTNVDATVLRLHIQSLLLLPGNKDISTVTGLC